MKLEKEAMALQPLLFVVILLLSGPTSIDSVTDSSDSSALGVMYSSLNSPSQLTNWNSSGGDPCGDSWLGITCSGSRVTEIKIAGLGLSGSIGYQLSSLTFVTIFDLSNNNLGNDIPYQLPPNVQQLNLGGNGFTGSIPYSISLMTSLVYLNLGHNQLQGQSNDIFGQLSKLSTLDLSFNSLTGNLSQSMSSLTSMTNMYLQNNQFTGTIDVLANLPLQNLNIENNRFVGWIPAPLASINIQQGGNLLNSGPAPPPPPGTPPTPTGNPNSSNENNRPNVSTTSSDGGSKKKSGISGGAVAGIVISLLVVGSVIAFFIMRKRTRRSSTDIEKFDNQPLAPHVSNDVQELKSIPTVSSVETKKQYEPLASINLKPPPNDRHKSFDGEEDRLRKPILKKKTDRTLINATSYSIADLQLATESFSVDNLIGDGSIGRVYRAEFNDGKVLAVKKINSSALSSDSSEDFLEIVSNLSRLHHPNITEFVGYCCEHGLHLLAYEFHKTGSLHDFLHLSDEYSKPLIWNTRVKIALGTARALEYLHEVCSPSIVHKNVKSANILLDVDLNPRMSDAGLSSLIPDADLALNHNAGSGYSAPEVAMSAQYTIKSDVYSFGIVMLELLTGRKPFDSSRSRAEQSLVRWATPQLHDIDALTKMVDPALKGLYPVKSLSRFADVIALCVQSEPEFRPPMSEVVQSLVLLVQRANMSKRTVGNDRQTDNSESYDDY
ncbi:protein STRUBBELIG-RECEPTOR FAMILY 7-like [Impatiens glandulifera]|uniref:protein STRUBBELIG-RECEPTOR FAMILY 7-like n=1 Tax=Impatiens glandulifera TaxID=253017 RepID=UPI001FB16553|nr:protein STRUBBELIG-RECEPTOR FAMILY 7-like [Impatiens glandulifera]